MIPVGYGPIAVGVDSTVNKIYTANFDSNTVTVIDGPTNFASTSAVGEMPRVRLASTRRRIGRMLEVCPPTALPWLVFLAGPCTTQR